MSYFMRWQPMVDAADVLVTGSRWRGQPVWVDEAVRDIARAHPEGLLTPAQLTEVVRELVIEKRWSMCP